MTDPDQPGSRVDETAAAERTDPPPADAARPAPPRDSSAALWLVLAPFVILSVLLVAMSVSVRPPSSPSRSSAPAGRPPATTAPATDPITRIGEAMLKDPRIRARYGTSMTAGEAFSVGQRLQVDGLAYLSAPELDRVVSAQRELLDAADDRTCARLARGTLTVADAPGLRGAVRRIPAAQQDAYVTAVLTVIEAGLRGGPLAPRLTEAEQEKARDVIIRALGADYDTWTQGYTETSPDRTTCDAEKLFLTRVLAQPAPDRLLVWRLTQNP